MNTSLLFYILTFFSINISNGAYSNAPLYHLIELLDYYDQREKKCILAFPYNSGNNVIIRNYEYILDFKICGGISNYINYDTCTNHGNIKENSEINFGRISSNSFLVFQKQNATLRIFIENYDYYFHLDMENSICLDFFYSHNKLRMKLKNPVSFDVYLNIQYYSNSTQGKIQTNINLINSDKNQYVINNNFNSLNIIEKIEPSYNYIFEFSPPKGDGAHSMYCLYYSYYDNFILYVNSFTQKVPIIIAQNYTFFSTYDENKVNITTRRYTITYYFKIKHIKIKNCLALYTELYHDKANSKIENCTPSKLDNEDYFSVSLRIVKNFTYSYIYLELYPDELSKDNYVGIFLEYNRTIENEEYLGEILEDLLVGLFLILAALNFISLFMWKIFDKLN